MLALGMLCILSVLSAAFGACRHAAPLPPAPGMAGVPPWELPAAAIGSQRLYRLQAQGPEGDARLRVTLRLAAADRYQLTAADSLGRPVWTLDASREDFLLLDHRERQYCRWTGESATAALPFALSPSLSLPAVLLGRLPARPLAGEEPTSAPAPSDAGPGVESIAYPAGSGARLTAELDAAGVPVRWTWWRAGEPELWWTRVNGESRLTARRPSVALRWQEVVAEPLPGPLAEIAVPAAFTPGECRAPDLP